MTATSTIAKCVVVLVCMWLTPDVRANPMVQHRFATVGLPAFNWDEDQAIQMSGVAMYIKQFSTGLAISKAGQILADHAGLFQFVLTAPGGLMLSGVKAGWHWLAEIESTSAGSKGRVSVLRISPKTAVADDQPGQELDRLLPTSATFLSRIQTSDGRNITQKIYRAAMPMHELLADVRAHLMARGWRSMPDFPGLHGHDAWHRESSTLSLFAHSAGNATLLYAHLVK